MNFFLALVRDFLLFAAGDCNGIFIATLLKIFGVVLLNDPLEFVVDEVHDAGIAGLGSLRLAVLAPRSAIEGKVVKIFEIEVGVGVSDKALEDWSDGEVEAGVEDGAELRSELCAGARNLSQRKMEKMRSINGLVSTITRGSVRERTATYAGSGEYLRCMNKGVRLKDGRVFLQHELRHIQVMWFVLLGLHARFKIMPNCLCNYYQKSLIVESLSPKIPYIRPFPPLPLYPPSARLPPPYLAAWAHSTPYARPRLICFFLSFLTYYMKDHQTKPQYITLTNVLNKIMPPAFSIGKQPKLPSFISDSGSPGVGTYNENLRASSKVSKPSTMVIGRETRMKSQASHGPGPTSYDLTQYENISREKKRFHISSRGRQRINSEGPGPGSYEIPKMSTSTKFYSIAKRSKERLPSEGPGPGYYNPDARRDSLAISFEKSHRPSLENSSTKIGPGSYNVSPTHETRDKYSFPHRPKFFEDEMQRKERDRLPGPSAYTYNLNQCKKKVVAAKFNKNRREFQIVNQDLPGPGVYQLTNTTKCRSPVATIGNSPKQGLKKLNVPGPGAYEPKVNILKRNQPSVRFGTSPRNENNKSEFSKVGPGSYEIQIPEHRTAYSISMRTSKDKMQPRPGPESYSPKFQSVLRKTETASIGKEKKMLYREQKIPGPGQYNIERPKNMSKTFFFPKDRSIPKQNGNPGPGAYEIKPIIGSDSRRE